MKKLTTCHSFIILFFDNVVDLVLSDEVTIALVFEFEAESFARKNT